MRCSKETFKIKEIVKLLGGNDVMTTIRNRLITEEIHLLQEISNKTTQFAIDMGCGALARMMDTETGREELNEISMWIKSEFQVQVRFELSAKIDGYVPTNRKGVKHHPLKRVVFRPQSL